MNRRVVFPRPLQYLMAIAEHGSYTKAAESLHVSQPSLSQQIKQLEETLQAPLLVRSGRSVRLTDAGEIYLHHAKRAYVELDAGTRAIGDVNDLSRGSLRIGWTPITDYLACSLLERFSRRFPGITLSTLEMPADDIESAVAEDRVDVGIAFGHLNTPEALDPEIQATQLFQETLCFAVGNNHARAGQKERISSQELNNETLILLNRDFALRRRVDSYCLKHGIMPHIAIETDSLSVIVEMVQNSPYGTILPKTIIQTQYGISPIVAAPALPRQPISLISRRSGYSSPASIEFSRLATDWAVDRITIFENRKIRPSPFENNNSQSKKD